MERRLGKGLGSLLGSTIEADAANDRMEIPLAKIRPNPFQPRKEFDPAALEELKRSLLQHGLLQPVCVRPAGDGYELIAGERRWRASRLAGLESIPAIVREGVGDGDMLELALVENIQRRDLGVLEKAQGYREMMDRLGLTQEAVADKVGLKRATVANHLRLLELPEAAREALERELITMGHARALLGLQKPAAVLSGLSATVRKGWSVRQLEEWVRGQRESAGEAGEAREATRTIVPRAPWIAEMERRIREQLGVRVTIRNRPGYRGEITLEYCDRAELDRLCECLAPPDELV